MGPEDNPADGVQMTPEDLAAWEEFIAITPWWVKEADALRVRVADQESAIARLGLDLEVERAKVRMACSRLGGLVEGGPPHPGNFLQRIDELVRFESRAKATDPTPAT